MAIFQPTNTIPSSFNNGTIDVNDNIDISWQVNGNSAMTAFQIDFFANDYASTPIKSTGKLPKNNETQAQYNLPFYGTDRLGRPKFFNWNASYSWRAWDSKFVNGSSYKYKITQYYVADEFEYNLTVATTVSMSIRNVYFKINDNLYITFTLPTSFDTQDVTFYYNTKTKQGHYVKNTTTQYLAMTEATTQPTAGYSLGTATNEVKVVQNSMSVITTRTKPTITIYNSNSTYEEEKSFVNNGTFSASIGFFKAKYEQQERDAIRWIRWEVASANNGQINEILDDTNEIYTPILNYEFNGFFKSQQYAIRAICESESGQQVNSNPTTDGWIYFTIDIQNQGEYSGKFTSKCLKNENATLLEWEAVEVIPAQVSPTGYNPTTTNSSVELLPTVNGQDYSVTWNKKVINNQETPMNFTAPWCSVWKGKVPYISLDITVDLYNTLDLIGIGLSSVFDLAFSPDGKLFVVTFKGGRCLYFKVTDKNLIYGGEVTLGSGERIGYTACNIRFNHTNELMFLVNDTNISGNPLSNPAYVFKIDTNQTVVTYLGEINNNGRPYNINDIVFNNESNYLYAFVMDEQGESSCVYRFLVEGTSIGAITYQKLIYRYYSYAGGGKLALSPDGKILVSYINSNLHYNLSQDGITRYFYIDDTNNVIYDKGEVDKINYAVDNYVSSVAFSRFDPVSITYYMAVCGKFNGVFNLYSSNYGSSDITFLQNITKNGVPFDSSAILSEPKCMFNPTGNNLFFSGINPNNSSEIYTFEHSRVMLYNRDLPIYTNKFTFYPREETLFAVDGNDGSVMYNYLIYYKDISAKGKFFEVKNNSTTQVSIVGTEDEIEITCNNSTLYFTIPLNSETAAFVCTPTQVFAYFYDKASLIDQDYNDITSENWQRPVTSISIMGGTNGTTTYNVALFDGEYSEETFNDLYSNVDFEPLWNDREQYSLYMSAYFNNSLEGGTGTANGSGFRIYRQELGKNTLTPIATVSSTTTSLKDYGITSRKSYKYSLYAYDINNAFMNEVEAENVISTCFKNYSLLVCRYDETRNEYHLIKQYLFALNFSISLVSNNNRPTLNANFTPYPTKMPSVQNYKSGTLQSLIGAIYTIPALVEQIGNFKHTTKPSTIDYFDNVDLEKELFDLSVLPYSLFLRDMKGHLTMVAISDAISMTPNIKQKQQSISISLPWVEIGDASNVTIIQTPNDIAWDYNQVLEISLDVDTNSGELYATYPFPYNGTKFYLTGINKEILSAKTPLGITPKQFSLSETATQPKDGELNVVKNTENN